MTTTNIWYNYSKELKLFIIGKVKNNTVADDILQNTFLKIHTKFHTLKDITKIKPWIFTIARNEVVSYFKTLKSTTLLEPVESLHEIEINKHTEQDCLRAIINNLPKKYRTPIYLSDVKGLKQHEIATKMNLPLPTVKSQIQRARKKVIEGFVYCCGLSINEKGKLTGAIKEKENCKVCS